MTRTECQIETAGPGGGGRSRIYAAIAIFVLALIMAAPTIQGRFVGGDDHRLVLNHVLISRPSLAHAAQLFTILHRDLYQPLPLLTFSAEFALADLFGLRADQTGPGGGAWIFHLTNILLHGVNAVLVGLVLLRLRASPIAAWVAAGLFAVHPLQVEVVAWTNGRMMLLSTLFALLTIRSACGLVETSRPRKGIALLVFLILTMLSKVRVGLPLLLLLVPLALRRRPDRRFWGVWVVSLVLTVGFALLNIKATAENEMFAHASERMEGSRVARTVVAVGWYLSHIVFPSGLASWYEAPGRVTWTDAATLRAIAVVAVALLALVWTVRRTRTGLLGSAWFGITLGSTLPLLLPARNLLAADRYMYLPIIGVFWIVGSVVVCAGRKMLDRGTTRGQVALAGWAAGVVLAGVLIGVSWQTSTYYQSAVNKTRRISQVHPDSPHVHERLGWAYFEEKEYASAIRAGETELARHGEATACDAWMLIGMSLFHDGQIEAGIEALRKAVKADPDNPMAGYRLASVLAQAGQLEEARALFEKVMPELPRFNPGLVRAANVYRTLGDTEKARAMYLRVLDNNAYDIYAPVALAEMDLEAGRLDAAVSRLEALIAWMPEHARARTNLGVCYARQGRMDLAAKAYREAVEADAFAYQAMVNLGELRRREDPEEAARWFERAIGASTEFPGESLAALHDLYVDEGRLEACAELWRSWLERSSPLDRPFLARAACALARVGEISRARELAGSLPVASESARCVEVVEAVRQLRQGDASSAVASIERLAADPSELATYLKADLLRDLQRAGTAHPDDPWPYFLAAILLEADGQPEAARMGYDVFVRLSSDERWRDRARERMAALVPPSAPASREP